MLGSPSAARPNASRLRPRSFAIARNRMPADTRTDPRAAAHRSATVVLPLPGGPPMTRIIDVPQAVSSTLSRSGTPIAWRRLRARLDFLELREPRLLALSHGFHILFPPRGHDLLRAGHLHPVRVVVPDDRADRRRQDAREENRQDRKGPTEAEEREQDRVRPAREPEPHLLVDDRVQREEEQENHEEPGQARAGERRWRPHRRGRLLGRVVRRLVRRFLGLFLRYLLGIRRAGIIGHGCANGRADIRICSVASGGNQPLSAGVGAVPRADWIFVARSSYRCVRAFSCFWRDFTRIVRVSLCSSSSFFSASRSSCRTSSIPMLLYTGVSSLILPSSSKVPSISRSFASSWTRWLPRTWSWFCSCWYWAIWF